MIIITGCGKSGTMFAARLFHLNHEPRRTDPQVLVECFYDEDKSREYIEETFTGDERESNSFLAVHTRAIKERYPDATIIQLVRHPLDTVASLMSASLYQENITVPRQNIKLKVNGWDNLSRLEKVSHWWVEVNKRVRLCAVPFLRLEDLGGKPVNQGTHEYTRDTWSDKQIETIRRICDKEAKNYNYKI